MGRTTAENRPFGLEGHGDKVKGVSFNLLVGGSRLVWKDRGCS